MENKSSCDYCGETLCIDPTSMSAESSEQAVESSNGQAVLYNTGHMILYSAAATCERCGTTSEAEMRDQDEYLEYYTP